MMRSRGLVPALALALALAGCVSRGLAQLDDEGHRLAIPEPSTHRAQEGESGGLFGASRVVVSASYPAALDAAKLAGETRRQLGFAGWVMDAATNATIAEGARNGVHVRCETGLPHAPPMPDGIRPDEDLMRCALTLA